MAKRSLLVLGITVAFATYAHETSTSAFSSEPSGVGAEFPGASNSTDGLRLDFLGAPLKLVLDYLSKAAGLIFVSQGQPKGNVDVWSDSPVSQHQAVELLNTALERNGSAAIQNGRIVTILNPDEAKLHHPGVT